MESNKTAKELVLELFKEDHITKEEFMLLFEAISNQGIQYQPFQPTTTFPQPDVTPYPTQPNIWYTTTTPNNIPYGTGGITNNNDTLTKNV